MVLEGTVSYSQLRDAPVFVGKKPQVVGTVEVRLTYSCSKFFSKCFDNGSLKAEIEKDSDIDVSLEPVGVRWYGKLSASGMRDTHPAYLAVKVASGRGRGELEAAYRVKVSSLNKGKHRFSISFVYETPKGEKKRIGSPIDIEVDIRKPLKIEQFTLLPSLDYYVLGDSVEASLKILSEYSGTMSVSCDGALEGRAVTYQIAKGPQEIRLSLTVARPTRKAELIIRIPELEYEELIEESVDVERQRVLVENIEIEKSEIGEKAFMTISLVNMSKIGNSPIRIKADIYGYQLERSDVLKPMERKSLVIETPALSMDARKYLKGNVLLVDEVTGEELTKTVDLPSPAPVPIKIELISEERTIKIPLSMSGKIQLYISNESNVSMTIDLQETSFDLCSISMNKIMIPPLGYKFVDLELRPKSIGKKEVELNFMILVNDTLVDIHPVRIHIEVQRAFDIESIKVLSPSKTNHAVKGQEIEVEIVLKIYSDWVDISVESPDISVRGLVHRVYPPKAVIKFSGRVMNYLDSIEVSISDGMIKDDIKIPIKVEKPSIEYEITPTVVHVGVRKSLVLSLRNRFEVPLNVVIEIGKDSSVEFKNSVVNLRLGPLGEEKVDLEIAKIRIGSHKINLSIVSDFIDAKDKKIADRWEKKDAIEIEAVSPIAVTISNLPSSLMLPYSGYELESVVTPFSFDIYVENLIDEVVSEVSFRLRADQSLAININPSSMIVKPRSKERAIIMALTPASYSREDVSMVLVPIVEGFELPELEVKIVVSRFVFSVIEISKLKFIENRCPYPRSYRGDIVYVLIPITIEEVNVCGEPSDISIKRFEAVKTMHDVLAKNLLSYRNPWSTAASVIFKKVMHADTDFSGEREFLSSMTSTRKDIIVVSEALWFITLSKLLDRRREISSSHAKLLYDAEKVGSLYTLNSPLYKSRSNVYEGLVKLSLGKDSGESLQRFILSYVELGKIDPILLLYILNGGKEIPFDRELAEKIYNERRFDDYITYLAITNIQLVNNSDVLHKLAKAASSVRKNRGILALAILFNRIIQENIGMLKRG